jgi:hypothetical protein
VSPTVQKLTLDLLATITLKAVPLHAYATFIALLPFFKCIQKVMFCEDAHHRLQFCVGHLNCIKMVVFQFNLLSGKQRKVGWVRNDSHVVFGKKFPGEKGSVKQCIVMMQQSVSFVAKVRWEVVAHFYVAANRHSSVRN